MNKFHLYDVFPDSAKLGQSFSSQDRAESAAELRAANLIRRESKATAVVVVDNEGKTVKRVGVPR